MTTRRLELDYVAPRRRAAWVGLVVLALGLAAAAYLVERYREAQSEFARVEAAQRAAGEQPRPLRALPKERIDDEYKQVELVVQQLTLPWASLVQAVEEAGSSDIAVLQLQPEAQQRRLRLTAEAKNYDGMLAYLQRLGGTKVLYEVHLLSHQVQLEDAQRPTQFSLQASFRGGAVRQLNDWLQALGATGVLGLGVLLSCVPFYLSALRPLETELQVQRIAAERMQARSPLQPVASGDRAGELQRFYRLFPELGDLPAELKRLNELARASSLELQQGEYRLEKRGAGLAAYHVNLPIRGTYPAMREFIGAVLKSMPAASIDALSFERRKVAETELAAQLRLTVYFRPQDAAAN